VHAPVKKVQGNGVMEPGGGGDDGGVDPAGQVAVVGQRRRAAFDGEAISRLGQRIDDGDQLGASSRASFRAWKPPRRPAPITATRSLFTPPS